MKRIVEKATTDAIKILNYVGPIQLKLRPLTPEAIKIWERKMKLVNFK